MAVWALADLHLALGEPQKRMDVFGGNWVNYIEKMEQNWEKFVATDDLVLLAGDISWAMHAKDALLDLNWIDRKPGTKVLILGNHDYWFESRKKIASYLPSSLHILHNDAFCYGSVAIAGTRLWDSYEYSFENCIEYIPRPEKAVPKKKIALTPEENEKIFLRELGRLERSLQCLNPKASVRIAMTHYPPLGPDFKPSRVSALLEKYRVNYCIFGHIHNVREECSLSGKLNGIEYIFAACDKLNGMPIKVCESPKN